jgi:ribosomal protein S18 acetylase RimI-like enzyme
MEFQFLDKIEFSTVHQAFVGAFSDYIIPMRPTYEQLREMFDRRGANMAISAGAFLDRKLVGFTINAIDTYQKLRTVYDTGSGVLPEYRRRGISDAIFRLLLPKLKEAGAEQYLLEVFEQNVPAVRLYEKTGFRVSRKFQAFRRSIGSAASQNSRFEIREIVPEWSYWARQWDWEPSWQNSIRSIERSLAPKTILGIFSENTCIGYGIVYPSSGDVPHFCIVPEFRRRRAGTLLMHALQNSAGVDRELRAINIESTAETAIHFLESCGFQKFGTQLEMRMRF